MKRLVAVILIFIVLTATAGSTFAQPNASGQNKSATGLLKSVTYKAQNGSEIVDIMVVNYTDYSIMRLSGPDRIVIDIFNAAAPGKQQLIRANGAVIKTVRYAQFEPYIARVVLDVNGQAEYGVEKSETGLRLYIGDKPDTNRETDEGSNTPDVEVTPDHDNTSGGTKATPQKLSVSKYFNIEYTPKGNTEEVAILLSNYSKYTIMRMTGPDRLVIDIPNTKYSSKLQQILSNGTRIKSIRYSKYSSKISRIVLDLNGQSKYTVKESKGKLLLILEGPAYKNMLYHNNGDRVYITLQGAKLTSGDEFLTKLYTEKLENLGKKYVVTFPTVQADLGEGKLEINDDYLKFIEIKNNISAKTTSITFQGVKKLSYMVFTRTNPEDTAITLLKPAAKAEKLVVIDPGHGGRMPGAIYKGLYEKDLNLDIAVRLNKLLEKKKIKTYMLREEDIDVANYERAYIANKLNASLYLSIHNNAMDDPGFSGTMTLYYPQKSLDKGFNGKTFANIIQNKLLSNLGTVNRKVIERPNLVVLKATAMPAALAEVAFMTNINDRNNLEKEAFRQKAAEALCDSIVEALKAIK